MPKIERGLFTKQKTRGVQPATVYPTLLESVIRRIFAILIIANAALALTYGLLLVPLAVFIGLFLFFRKRYFLWPAIFILPIGALLYFLTLPLIGPDAWSLKIFILEAPEGPLVAVFLIGKILIFAAGLIFTASGILSQFKIFRDSPKRGLIIFYISIIITGSLVIAPLLRPMGLILNDQEGQFGENCSPEKFAFPEQTMEVTVDTQHKMWVYHWSAKNSLNEKVSISEITGLKPGPKLLGLFQLLTEKVTIAPPFGQQIDVSGAQKDTEGITVEPGAKFNMQIISSDPLYVLTVPIGNHCTLNYGFLKPGGDVESINEALAPEVHFFTSGTKISSSSPTEQTIFSAGETIYPVVTGLKKGTTYGLQVTDQSGQSVIPFDTYGTCTSIKTGSTEGCGEINDKNQPLGPGTYEIQLIKVLGGKGTIIAKTQIVIITSKQKFDFGSLKDYTIG